jgi:hypothetical protein
MHVALKLDDDQPLSLSLSLCGCSSRTGAASMALVRNGQAEEKKSWIDASLYVL